MPSLSVRAIAAAALALALPFAATACGGGDGGDDNKVVIGTKFDQPGLGLKNPDGTMSGFDVDVAKLSHNSSATPEDIEWKESPSGQRETLIQNDQVDYIAATYSITDARKEKVDFAGPYLITGQKLLVRADNTDITGAESLQNNKKLCSVTGSTPAQRIKDEFAGCAAAAVRHLLGVHRGAEERRDRRRHHRRGDPAGYAAQSPVQGRRPALLGGALRNRPEEGRHRAADQDQRRDREDGAGRRLEGGGTRTSGRPGSRPGAAADRPDLSRSPSPASPTWRSSTSIAARSSRRSGPRSS